MHGDVSEEEIHQIVTAAAISVVGRIERIATATGVQTYGDSKTAVVENFDQPECEIIGRLFAVSCTCGFEPAASGEPSMRISETAPGEVLLKWRLELLVG